MCNDLHEWDLRDEQCYQTGSTLRRLFSFGFALSPWQTVPYVEYPSIGKFEGDRFDPAAWRPQTPTTAYLELRDDDAFWAARRVAAFTDELIRAAVHTGKYSDPAAEKYLADVLIKRRDKVASTYLTAVNPIVSPRLEPGRLTFDNAAFAAGVTNAPVTYRASWFQFDNATGETRPLAQTDGTTTSLEAPRNLPTASGTFVGVDVAADSETYASWRRPVRAYFRRANEQWTLVGFERLPEKVTNVPDSTRRERATR